MSNLQGKVQFVFLHQSQIISEKPKSSFEGKQNKEYSIIFAKLENPHIA